MPRGYGVGWAREGTGHLELVVRWERVKELDSCKEKARDPGGLGLPRLDTTLTLLISSRSSACIQMGLWSSRSDTRMGW